MLRDARAAESRATAVSELRERSLAGAWRRTEPRYDRALPGARSRRSERTALVNPRLRRPILLHFRFNAGQCAPPVLRHLIATIEHPHDTLRPVDLHAALTDRAAVDDRAQVLADLGVHDVNGHCGRLSVSVVELG